MKRILKYLSLTAFALMSVVACEEKYDVQLDSALLYDSIEISYPDDLTRAKIYTDETGSSTLPLVIGEQVSLSYTISPDPSEVTFKEVEWISSDESVVTVNGNGSVTAVGEGIAVVTVQPATVNIGVSSSIRVRVVSSVVQVTSIEISDNSIFTDETYGLPACYVGESLQLSVTITPDDATYKTVYWTSSDDGTATVDAVSGVVTGVTVGRVTIIATALDDGAASATHEIYIDQIVSPVGVSIVEDPADKFSIDDDSYTISYVTYPQLSTTSLLSWESSDETVATVANGVVTFRSYGRATITVTCPDSDETIPDGYSKTISIVISIPAGYYNEHFENESTNKWALNSSHVTNGASMERYYNETTGEYYYLVIPYLSGTTGRGDIQHSGSSVYLDPTSYPIMCLRFDDVGDYDFGYTRNINIDTSGSDVSGNSFSGNFGGSNNKWRTKYKCSDGSAIFEYDLSTQEFQNGGSLTSIGTFGTFQIKYADIKEVSTVATDAAYRYFWFMTFESEDAMKAYLNQWSADTAITFEQAD